MNCNSIDSINRLFDISQKIIETNDIRGVLPSVIMLLAQNEGITKIMISIVSKKNGDIFVTAAYGLTEEEQKRGVYKPGEGITGKVVETGLPHIVKRISDDPLFLDRTGSRSEEDMDNTAFVCLPVKVGSEVIGTLSADCSNVDKELLDNNIKTMSIVVSMIAQAVYLYQLEHEERTHLIEENRRLQSQLGEQFRPANIIGNSKAMRVVFDLIQKVSHTSANLLILGESGVGKELVASAVHFESDRKDKPFVKFNCAALTESIIESELFGHEKGAFSGAIDSRPGKFELANGGTIFLDEIGEISLSTQAKLLRVLQEREFERVGGRKTIQIDVRVITATNRNLEELVAAGEFRADLFYRLNVFPLGVPPLRERKTDILLLAEYFLEKYGRLNNKQVRRISTPAIDMLMSYHWPGNVRELENCMERAVILSDDQVIHAHHLPPSLQTATSSKTGYMGSLQKAVDSLEYEMIIEALKEHKGNMSKAAVELGLTDRVMNLRVKKYGIRYKDYRI
jgi:Nif-specific regulatory protein